MNRLARAALARKDAGLEIIPLHSPDFDFSTSFFPRGLLTEGAKHFAEGLSYRPDPLGLRSAREAIAQFYARDFGVCPDPDELLLTSSTSEAYAWIFRALPEGAIVSAPPVYPLFEHIAQYTDRALIVQSEGPERDGENKPAAVLCVSPANPTGEITRSFSRPESVPVIFDEVFSSFVWQEDLVGHSFPRPSGYSFSLNGASKLLCAPWLKIAWIWMQNAPEAVRENLEMISDTFLSVNSLAQEILPDLLLRSPEILKPYRKTLLENQALAAQMLPADLFHVPQISAGLTQVVHFREEAAARFADEEEFAVRLLSKTGVHVYPGYFFELQNCFVISFAQRPDRLREGLARIADFSRA